MMILVNLVLIVTAVILFFIYARGKLNYWKKRGVESLEGDLIFGNFKDAILFRSAPGWHIGQLYKAAWADAAYVGFYIFHKPCLLLRDPDVIRQFMIHDFKNFSDRHFASSNQKDSIGMRNLFGVKNPVWKYLRLGTKMDTFHHPNTEFLSGVYKFFHSFKRMVALVTVFFMPELVELIGAKILFDSSFVRKVFWSAMENREKTGEKRGDFIDSLLQLKYGEQNPVYSE
nr:PREDICTED: LOW QUALITY PROTEIN: cytochrome P450 6k1-like [Linepithema humile]